MRRLALALPLALLGACTQDPPGRCDQDLECLAGQICTDGLCLPIVTDHQIGSLCARDTDCVAWGECLSRVCELRAGACEDVGDCDGWEVCTDHACTLAPNGCPDESACGSWQDCVAYRCGAAPGFCDGDADCKAWQACGPAHLCVTAGSCASSADCAGWESCDAGGACAPAIACTDGSECVAADVCLGGFCSAPVTLDPDAVHLLGTFLDGSGSVDAVCALASPTRALVGFPSGVGATARIGPGGTLVYEHVSVGRSLRRFVPDALEWDAVGGTWDLPADPIANDLPAIPTPGCPTDVGEWVMQAGTGEVRYACTGDAAVWYGTLGAAPVVSGYRLLAWDAAGLMLAVRASDDTLVVLDASFVETVVSGAPALTGYGLVTARTHGGGFWLAVVPPAPTGTRRWTVNGAGLFVDEGVFSAAPVELSAGPPSVLDVSGALHQSGVRALPDPEPPQDVVVRCELDPGGCALVYDEADATLQDWAATPPRLYLLVDGSPLATGP